MLKAFYGCVYSILNMGLGAEEEVAFTKLC